MTIRKYLQTAIILYSTAIAILLICNVGVIGVLSAVQEFVRGEGIWSRAQKDAVLNLQDYLLNGQEVSFERFEENLKVIASDSIARRELEKQSPDFAISDRGFIGGGIDPADVRMMGYLFRYGRDLPPLGSSDRDLARR